MRLEGEIILCCTQCYIGNPAAAIGEWGSCFTLSYILYDTVGSVIARFVVTFVNWYYLGGFLWSWNVSECRGCDSFVVGLLCFAANPLYFWSWFYDVVFVLSSLAFILPRKSELVIYLHFVYVFEDHNV